VTVARFLAYVAAPVVAVTLVLHGPLLLAVLMHGCHPRHDDAREEVGTLVKGLELFRRRKGHCPPPERGLELLVAAQIIDKTVDPWGNAYRYTLANGVAEVSTLGADGVPGGDGGDEDIALRLACPPGP
jgi:general secretion pathway protein G